MEETEPSQVDETLDPPGTIAVVGAGPLGIEAAMYGRYLGYDVTLIEAECVGHSLRDEHDQPMPMMPDRCLSPLAVGAINAQSPDAPPYILPTTIGEWIDKAMIPLTNTDLLKGRLRCPCKIESIALMDVEPDEEDLQEDQSASIPPDFLLVSSDGASIEAECVIMAVGGRDDIDRKFDEPKEYFFQIGGFKYESHEANLLAGLKQIVQVYAQLAGRPSLDLYQRKPLADS